jgi:AcrR family transcriptional regulator
MTHPMRKDAVRRRDALQKAAAAEFAERGLDVPLDAIADRAGVGRATLYRNFADRNALLAAVFGHLVDGLGDRFRQNAGANAFFEFIDELADLVLHNVAVSTALRDSGSREVLIEMRRKIIAAGAHALSSSQAAGKVRADLGAEDIRIVAALLAAGLETAHPAEREAISRRTRAFLLDGLKPRP